MLRVLLGGARSGKSDLAERVARATDAHVAVIVTGEALDDEMQERIESHRLGRPAGWQVVEEPYALEASLHGIEPATTVIVDCLTLWVSNLMRLGDTDEDVVRAAGTAAAFAASSGGGQVASGGAGRVPARSSRAVSVDRHARS